MKKNKSTLINSKTIMGASKICIATVIVALFQSLAVVEAFATSSKPIEARRSWSPLHSKNELVSDVEDEVLVSKKGNKKCCKGCAGCPIGNDLRDTEPNVLKTLEDTSNNHMEISLKTNYQDTAAGEGLPLFHSAGLESLDFIFIL